MMSKYSTASFHAREAADCLSVAERISDEFTMHSYRAFAIEHLTLTADALGYDMIKRQPAAPAEPAMTETDAAVRDLLRATADAGYMRAADYVALNQEPPAVTGQPGFDGRNITNQDIIKAGIWYVCKNSIQGETK
jgi:hypothetical protein